MSASCDADVWVHPTAICASDRVGPGTHVWAFAHVMGDAQIGARCNICDHVFIESGVTIGDGVTVKNRSLLFEGVTLEDHVFVGPGVIFTNDRYPRSARMPEVADHYSDKAHWLVPIVVEHGASVGAGATIVAGVRIGAFAMVGAGAVVTRDVPAHRLVAGRPAKPVGWVCLCGEPLRDGLTCARCGRTHELVDDRLCCMEPEHV
ncbi:MAG: acyltransferase [Phycisphaerae bacterium]